MVCWIAVNEYGTDEAYDICKANNETPDLNIRINRLKGDISDIKDVLEADGIQYENTEIKDSYSVKGLNNIGNYKLFLKGYFTLQDSAATMVGHIVNAKKGDNVLDLCSSPGSKTTHIAEIMDNTGNIVACDIYENRLKLVDENAKRLGIDIIKTQINDGLVLNQDFVYKFDKVLLDAPCSGFGVIRRKPDIKWQRKIEDISNIGNIQYKILLNAAKYVKVGGSIIYSTCTILKEENEKILLKNSYQKTMTLN